MDEVNRLRTRIDGIDQEIVRALKDRYENARELGSIKRARGLGFQDPTRERIILEKVERAAAKMGVDPELVRPIFSKIFTLSVQAQKNDSKNNNLKLNKSRVLIVGGTGGMGRFFARFVRIHGASVKIVGHRTNRTRKVAKDMEVQPGSLLDAATSDIVIVVVPMKVTRQVSTESAEIMPQGALLMDLSSVKAGISDKIASKLPDGVEYVSLHPLFGPTVDHLYGQNVVAVPYRSGPRWEKFSKVMENEGARISETSAESHDKAMSYVQALHHFGLISLGLGLNGWGEQFTTNSLRTTEESVRNILANWETVIGIQRLNPYAQTGRSHFLETVTRFVRMDHQQAETARRRLLANVQKWSRKQ